MRKAPWFLALLVACGLAGTAVADPVVITPSIVDASHHFFVPASIGEGKDKVTINQDREILEQANLWQDCLELLFKVDEDEEGSFAAYYSGSFSDSSGTITWDGPNFISGSPIYLIVKDGAHGHYVFDLVTLGWDGKETINLSGFYPEEGAISHLSIWGCGGTTVPEPGTLTLLGLGLLAGGLAWRRRS